LMRPRSWTKEEVDTLRSLYPSSASFHDLLDQLPSRSPNSIRLMASRLGLKRSTILVGIKKVGETKTSASAGGGVLVKCSQCGGWIGVSADRVSTRCVIVCDQCGGISLISD
jgi:predicted transcriptional regulator